MKRLIFFALLVLSANVFGQRITDNNTRVGYMELRANMLHLPTDTVITTAVNATVCDQLAKKNGVVYTYDCIFHKWVPVSPAGLADSLAANTLQRVTERGNTTNQDVYLDVPSAGRLRLTAANGVVNRAYSLTTNGGSFRPLEFLSGGVVISPRNGSAFGDDGVNALQVNGSAYFQSEITLNKFHNNSTLDSVLATDINGALKLVKLPIVANIYNSDGALPSIATRTFDLNNGTFIIRNGATSISSTSSGVNGQVFTSGGMGLIESVYSSSDVAQTGADARPTGRSAYLRFNTGSGINRLFSNSRTAITYYVENTPSSNNDTIFNVFADGIMRSKAYPNTTGKLLSTDANGNFTLIAAPLNNIYTGNGVLTSNRTLTGKNNAYSLTLDSLLSFKVNTTASGYAISQQSFLFSISNAAGSNLTMNTGAFQLGTGTVGGNYSTLSASSGNMTLIGTTTVAITGTPLLSITTDSVKINTSRKNIQLNNFINNSTLDSVLATDVNGYLIQRKNGSFASVINVKEGANLPMGLATFASGTTSVVVSNTNITANTRVQLSIQSYSGSTTTISAPYISARTAGTSFTITWSKGVGTDTGTVSWLLFEPY